MFFLPPETIIFLAFQLPASLVLGMVAGVIVLDVAVVRRGRISLRMSAGLVLIAALESAILAQNPAAWMALTPAFLLSGGAMVLVDLAIILGLDRRRPSPRFSTSTRRRALVATAPGLVALGLISGAFFKYIIAFNPTMVSWFDATSGFLGLLVFPALLDATIRVVVGKIQRVRPTTC